MSVQKITTADFIYFLKRRNVMYFCVRQYNNYILKLIIDFKFNLFC